MRACQAMESEGPTRARNQLREPLFGAELGPCCCPSEGSSHGPSIGPAFERLREQRPNTSHSWPSASPGTSPSTTPSCTQHQEHPCVSRPRSHNEDEGAGSGRLGARQISDGVVEVKSTPRGHREVEGVEQAR